MFVSLYMYVYVYVYSCMFLTTGVCEFVCLCVCAYEHVLCEGLSMHYERALRIRVLTLLICTRTKPVINVFTSRRPDVCVCRGVQPSEAMMHPPVSDSPYFRKN